MSDIKKRLIKRTFGKNTQFAIQTSMGALRVFSDDETFSNETSAKLRWKEVKKKYKLSLRGTEEVLDEV